MDIELKICAMSMIVAMMIFCLNCFCSHGWLMNRVLYSGFMLSVITATISSLIWVWGK